MKKTKRKSVSSRILLIFIFPLTTTYMYLNFRYFDNTFLKNSENLLNNSNENEHPSVTQASVNNIAVHNNMKTKKKVSKHFHAEKKSLTTGTSALKEESGKHRDTKLGEDPPMLEDKKEVVEQRMRKDKGEGTDAKVDKKSIESSEDTHSISHDDSQYPFTFSGCLMVKDDNQLLPEWLAYQYTFLPLRHLIIAVDPMSYTRVEGLVDKFRSIGMKIMLMTGNEYFVDGPWHKNTFRYFDPKNHTKEHHFAFLMQRQNTFYERCFQILQKKGFNYTITLDSDEFFTYNQEWDKTYSYNESSSEGIPDVPSLVGKQNETLAHWIDSGADPIFDNLQNIEYEGCIVLPRVLVSSIESTVEETAGHLEEGFNASYFNTILYQRRGILGSGGMQHGKPLLYLNKYNDREHVRNPHAPFERCYISKKDKKPPSFVFRHGSITEIPHVYSIQVHHNVGNFETYGPLKIKGKGEILARNEHVTSLGVLRDCSKAGWLQEFIKLVGKEKALEVTQAFRIRAKLEEKGIGESLMMNETVDFAYEWDTPKPKPSLEELAASEFK